MGLAAQYFPDDGQVKLRLLAEEIHGDLAGLGGPLVALATFYGLDGYTEVGGDGFYYGSVGYLAFCGCFHYVGDGLLGQVYRDRVAGEVGERDDLVEAALELADVLVDALGKELEDRIGDLLSHLLGLGAEDGNASLHVGGLDIHDETTGEPGLYAVFEQGERGHRPVGGEHYLAVGHVEGVECVEEALLRLFLADEELDVIQAGASRRCGSVP